MTIDTEKLKASAELFLKRGDNMSMAPGAILELLGEIESLKKDVESYIQACNYEVNRAAGLVTAGQQLIEVTDEIESIFKDGESMKLLALVPLGKIVRLQKTVKALGE